MVSPRVPYKSSKAIKSSPGPAQVLTPAETLFDGDLDATPIFKWDAARQGWISFQPGLPPAINGFLSVNRLDILSIGSPVGVSGQVLWPEAWPLG